MHKYQYPMNFTTYIHLADLKERRKKYATFKSLTHLEYSETAQQFFPGNIVRRGGRISLTNCPGDQVSLPTLPMPRS